MKLPKIEKLRRTYKAVIEIPAETQKELWFLSRIMVHLWNMGINEATKWLEMKEKAITAFSFNIWLTGARKSNVILKNGTIISLGDVSSDAEREMLRKLAGSYQSFFALKKKKDARAKMPWKREEDRFATLSWSSFSLENGILIVPGIAGKRIEIPIGEYLAKQVSDKNSVHATIAFRDGHFELSIVTAVPLPEKIDQPVFFRAIDLGAGDIAVTDSNGSEFIIPTRRPDKHWQEKIKSIEGRAEARTKGSRGWKRLMKARRHIWNKSGDQHISHQRKLARALVEDKVECVVIGKPKTRLGLARSASGTNAEHFGAQNTGYMFRLLVYIKDKAAERGIKVIEVPDPARVGNNADPETKLHATRTMLSEAMKESGIQMPLTFVRKHFDFVQ